MRGNRSTTTIGRGKSSSSSNGSSSSPPLKTSLIMGVVLISASTTTSLVLFLHMINFTATLSPSTTTENAMILPTTSLSPVTAAHRHALLRGGDEEEFSSSSRGVSSIESMSDLRKRLPSTVWSNRKLPADKMINHGEIKSKLSEDELTKARELCGKFLYSSLQRAIVMQGDRQAFVATGDIDDMWTRDSVVQMSIYLNRPNQHWLRMIVEGSLRRNAFNIIQDPYANAYEQEWKDPTKLQLRDSVIGRGGWVATKNYELDSGCYFLQQLYDYYIQEDDFYNPESLLKETIIVEAVVTMIDVWIVEQNHDAGSPYRYFELQNEGLGPKSKYTGMTWTGFRPSDDPCKYGYLIPANIHAAAALERILVLNDRIWKMESIHKKVSKLLKEIEDGINKYGIIETKDTGERIYAYEVDGFGNYLADFDDANVPSLLSIPLLGWSGYDKQVYRNTRLRLLSTKNQYYFEGKVVKGIGSPHTPKTYVWPMAMSIQGLSATKEDDITESMVFQIQQLLKSACKDAMHEGVSVDDTCRFSRAWFEWANALFVVLVETALGESCANSGAQQVLDGVVDKIKEESDKQKGGLYFYTNKYKNDYKNPLYFVGVEQRIPYKFPGQK